MTYRHYELSKMPGELVDFSTVKARRALIGKRVHYDLRGSIYMHSGTVTACYRREIEIDGNPISVRSIEQMAVTP